MDDRWRDIGRVVYKIEANQAIPFNSAVQRCLSDHLGPYIDQWKAEADRKLKERWNEDNRK